jgi:hypothetical protein
MGKSMDLSSNTAPARIRHLNAMNNQEVDQAQSFSGSRVRSPLFLRGRTTSMPHKVKTKETGTSPAKDHNSLSLRRLSVRRRKQAEAFSMTTADAPLSNASALSPSSRKRRLSLNFMRRENSLNTSLIKSRSKDSKGSSKASTKASTADGTDFEERGVHSQSLAERTKIVAELGTSPSNTSRVAPTEQLEERDELPVAESRDYGFNCATAILGHTYMEDFCGAPRHYSFENINSQDHSDLPEDPTIQESIECIFASQLEEGLGIWDDDEETQPQLPERSADDPLQMVSPSLLQQSRLNRCDRQATSLSQSKKRYEQASLVYVGTFDPSIVDNDKIMESSEGPLPCSCAQSSLPSLSPADWPQAPVLLRPTPGKGTRVIGVRHGSSKDYFWEPGSHLSWSECLANKWGVPCKPAPRVGCCEHCAVLPINNGNELDDEALVIDFESDLFVGSLLLRIRYTNGTTQEPYDDTKGYFMGMNRRYQAVVRGRFKKSIPLIQLRTGFQFDRPCGKLPAKFILRGCIKALSFFAPQLDAKMEGNKPHSLTPLGSTPQAICVDHDKAQESIQIVHSEPKENERTLLGHASQASSSLQRARARKKAFDKLFVNKSEEPRTDLSKVYTFEFLQHLFNFENFSIELGSMLGSVALKDILDGQPLQIMAAHGEHRLWSFDIWHENLWESAKRHDTHEPAQ